MFKKKKNQKLVTNLQPGMQKSYTGVNVCNKTTPVLSKRGFAEQDCNCSTPVFITVFN